MTRPPFVKRAGRSGPRGVRYTHGAVSCRTLAVLGVVASCGGAPQNPSSGTPAPAPAPHEAHAHGHHHHGSAHHRFDDAERWAAVFDDPARDAWQQPDRVIAELGLTPSMVVADVGAGTGYFAVRLAKVVARGQVLATDIEPAMVTYMAERARREQLTNLKAVQSTADDPALPAGGVDRILVVDVWHHLGDRIAYAKALGAALRTDGKILVVDFKLDSDRGPPTPMKLAPDQIASDLRAAGFQTAVTDSLLPDQYLVLAWR